MPTRSSRPMSSYTALPAAAWPSRSRREIDIVIAELKARPTAIAQDAGRHAVTTGDTGAVRGEARAAVDQVVTRLLEPTALPPAQPATGGRAPRVGDRVIVGGFGLE